MGVMDHGGHGEERRGPAREGKWCAWQVVSICDLCTSGMQDDVQVSYLFATAFGISGANSL